MKIPHKLITFAVFTSVLISGCQLSRPAENPFLAGEYLQRAEMAGAAEFAPDEYLRLQQEFLLLEKLYRKHQSAEIDERLPHFINAADDVIELTRQKISKAEALAAVTPESAPADTTERITTGEITPPGDRSVKPRLSYTVSTGELLSAIAKRADVYGDPLLWPLLYQANRDQIKDPRKIYAGQTLMIPRNVSEEEREKARNLAKKSDFFSPE